MRVAQSMDEIRHYVTKFEMASFLNDDLLRRLQLFHFPAYSTVFIEQDEAHYIYFLVKGQVQCYHYHLNGKLAVIAVSEPFSAIGDLEILNEAPVKSNVIATQDTIMLGIPSTEVRQFGADDPHFLRFVIDQLREKLYHSNAFQVNQVLPVISRVGLYMLAQRTTDDGTITLPDKEAFASLLGTTPRHLNRVIKELVDSETISANYPNVHILNRNALETLTE